MKINASYLDEYFLGYYVSNPEKMCTSFKEYAFCDIQIRFKVEKQ